MDSVYVTDLVYRIGGDMQDVEIKRHSKLVLGQSDMFQIMLQKWYQKATKLILSFKAFMAIL